MIQLDLLFDMERYRQERGALFVNWADVKPLDGSHEHTDWDQIGCYRGPNEFEGGVSLAAQLPPVSRICGQLTFS